MPPVQEWWHQLVAWESYIDPLISVSQSYPQIKILKAFFDEDNLYFKILGKSSEGPYLETSGFPTPPLCTT